ncbi:MAG: Elongation factor G, mitochondrial [Chaenotheca gracillima]|nr:MAG: Elongation factor G, mitochondrial [Chaenotheca gracillima]
MSEKIKQYRNLTPVTALAVLGQGSRQFVLSGQGPILQVFRHVSNGSLLQLPIFASQNIHGIAVEDVDTSFPGTLLFWGGRSVRQGHFHLENPGTKAETINIQLGEENQAPDWIFYAAFRPRELGTASFEHKSPLVLVTAHNSLIIVRDAKKLDRPELEQFTSSTRSLLYSAHCIWLSETRVLLASGTVFGEILISSCNIEKSKNSEEKAPNSLNLHAIFRGHEGSIFGVHISPELKTTYDHGSTRLLASCSDDRTVRIWDISAYTSSNAEALCDEPSASSGTRETGFGDSGMSNAPIDQPLAGSLTQVWAHASRIWAVRFASDTNLDSVPSSGLKVLSFGEDATCQTWRLEPLPAKDLESPASHGAPHWNMSPDEILTPHTGKNIWSAEVCCASSQRIKVATGGADGRVALAKLQNSQPQFRSQDSRRMTSFPDDTRRSNDHADLERNIEKLRPKKEGPLMRSGNIVDCRDLKDVFQADICDQSPNYKVGGSSKKLSHAFKCYAFFDFKEFLAITSEGFILRGSVIPPKMRQIDSQGDLEESSPDPKALIHWTSVLHLVPLRGYALMQSCPEERLAIFAASKGDIYYQFRDSEEVLLLLEGGSKVGSIFCENERPGLISILVSRLGSSVCDLICLDVENIRATGHSLQSSKYSRLELAHAFTPTAMFATTNLVILGSRSGSLAVYKIEPDSTLPSSPVAPIALFSEVHQTVDAITSITSIKPSSNFEDPGEFFLTTARDGTFAIHKLSNRSSSSAESELLNHELVHRASPPFGPMIEGVHFDSNGDLLLYGFRSRDFVVWNETKQMEVMTVDCGGAHRAYCFRPSLDGSGGGSFVWTKASKMHLHFQDQAQHHVLQNGGHGREIKALAVSPRINPEFGQPVPFFATGAEDTSIRIFSVEDSPGPFKSWSTLRGHITGIQHLQWSDCGNYLFSSASNEEFFVWKINPVPALQVGVVREAICPPASELSDLRVMSFEVKSLDGSTTIKHRGVKGFLISICYSDSTVRVYIYHTTSKEFELLAFGAYTTCCLTQVHQLIHPDGRLSLITASTDGHITYWPTSIELDFHSPTKLPVPLIPLETLPHSTEIKWSQSIKTHQNTILSMATATLSDSTELLITGGDDNALALTIARTRTSNSSPIGFSTLLIPRAHACAVTAIAVLPSHPGEVSSDVRTLRFASCGNDQRLKTWSVRLDLSREGTEGLSVKRETSTCTAVADVGCMDVMPIQDGGARVVICGVGMEVWTIVGTYAKLG